MTHLVQDSDAQLFGQHWVTAWNARDLDAVLDHYCDDVRFTSPFVTTVTGAADATLVGLAALRSYFAAALERYDDLLFSGLTVYAGAGSLSLLYEARLDGTVREAAETRVLDGHRATEVRCHYRSPR